VAKENKPSRGQYAEVVDKLKLVVASLESGELSLEDSLDRFGEGIALVKTGEKILGDAEARIERLLTDESTVPLAREAGFSNSSQVPPKEPGFQGSATLPTKTAGPVSSSIAKNLKSASTADEEDVPF
jgi:exodeoxyribonuclease VII small subunit